MASILLFTTKELNFCVCWCWLCLTMKNQAILIHMIHIWWSKGITDSFLTQMVCILPCTIKDALMCYIRMCLIELLRNHPVLVAISWLCFQLLSKRKWQRPTFGKRMLFNNDIIMSVHFTKPVADRVFNWISYNSIRTEYCLEFVPILKSFTFQYRTTFANAITIRLSDEYAEFISMVFWRFIENDSREIWFWIIHWVFCVVQLLLDLFISFSLNFLGKLIYTIWAFRHLSGLSNLRRNIYDEKWPNCTGVWV